MRHRHQHDLTTQADAEADGVILPHIDNASAVAQTDTVREFHVEGEYEALGQEQVAVFAAEGQQAARAAQVTAASLQTPATEAEHLVEQDRSNVDAARERHQHAERTLRPLARRDRFALYRYLLAWIILGLGDTSGILGAAILLGEIPYIAIGQALATGFAAVASGQAGSDLKDLRMARQRQRDPDELTDDERRYRHLFVGMEASVSIMRLVSWLSGVIVVIITAGIFSLRYSVEGMTSGLAFGALAAATALGSFLSTYSYTDEVADFLAATERAYRKAIAEHQKLAHTPAIVERAEAAETARSLTVEYEHRGRAAWWHIIALSKRILRHNPGVAGHGPAADPRDVIGRRQRSEAS